MDVRTAIRMRRSTRRYSEQPIPPELLTHLLTFAWEAEHLSRPGVRVAMVSGRERVARVLARYAGIYGLVQGAPHLLVGLVPDETEPSLLDLGYVLEQVVLEATRLGVASCWITGSYRPDQAVREVELREGEAVAAVVALGYPRTDRRARFHDEAIRRLAAAHQRRPLEALVFLDRWGQPWRPEEADPVLVEVLECARLAPSAVNRQPWRFVIRGQELHLALVDPAPIDGGIVMAHVALAAGELGQKGRWAVRWADRALSAELGLPSSVLPVGTFWPAFSEGVSESSAEDAFQAKTAANSLRKCP